MRDIYKAGDNTATHGEQRKGKADQPTEQTVRPFPKEDELKRAETHALVDQLIFRNLAIFIKGLLPILICQRRQGPGHGFPFGDGQARFGQAGDATDHHHEEDKTGNRIQPIGNRIWAGQGLGHAGRIGMQRHIAKPHLGSGYGGSG